MEKVTTSAYQPCGVRPRANPPLSATISSDKGGYSLHSSRAKKERALHIVWYADDFIFWTSGVS